MENNKQPQYFYVGQTVYHPIHGKGVVSDVSSGAFGVYPIEVNFENGGSMCFTFDGRYEIGETVSLSQNPIPEIVNQPICPFKEGDLVWVREQGRDGWALRFFCKMSGNGKSYLCYLDGTFGGDLVTEWYDCEPYSPETVDKYRVKK